MATTIAAPLATSLLEQTRRTGKQVRSACCQEDTVGVDRGEAGGEDGANEVEKLGLKLQRGLPRLRRATGYFAWCLPAVFAVTLSFGCIAPQLVRTEAGTPSAMHEHKSFSVAVLKAERDSSKLERSLTKRLGPEVARQLRDRGYRPLSEAPDVIVVVDVGATGISDFTTYQVSNRGLGMRTNLKTNDRFATVVSVDVVDPKSETVVWRAVARSRMRGDATDKELAELVGMIIGQVPLMAPSETADRRVTKR